MDHSTCRGKVCLLCLRKASGTIQGNNCLISTIKLYFIECFSIEDQHLPSGLCTSCKRKLFAIHSGDFTRTFNSLDHISELMAMRCSPRATDCNCRICFVAKANGWKAKALLKAIRTKKPAERSTTFTICAKCFGQCPDGIVHQCSRKDAAHNICDILPMDTQEKIASRVIREKTLANNNTPIQLKTGGRFRTVGKLPMAVLTKFLDRFTISKIVSL